MKKVLTNKALRILLLILVTSCISVSAGFTALASDKYKQEITEYAAEAYADSEDDKEIVDLIMESLEESGHTSLMDPACEGGAPTLKNAKKVIDEATAAGFGFSSVAAMRADTGAAAFADNWYIAYTENAKLYDIPTGDDWYDLSFGADDESKVEDAAMKANILTWDRKVDVDGNPIGETYQGKILLLLNKYDTEFGVLMQIIASIAVALTLAFGTANLLALSQDRMISTEALVREFLKILLGVWIVLNYRYFALLLIRLGTLFTEAVFNHSGADSTYNMAYDLLYKSLKQTLEFMASPRSAIVRGATSTTGFADWLKASLDEVGNLLSKIGGNSITHFVTGLTVYAIAIEISIRYVFTPIAIADLYTDKFRSNGFKWLKKLLAVSLQGAIIYLVIFGADALKTVVGGYGMSKSIINIVMLGMFAISRGIASDIVGDRPF